MKAYLVKEIYDDEHESYGYVVADNAREAKTLAWKGHPDTSASYDDDFTKLRVKLIRKKVNLEGLKKGWYDHSEHSLRRGIIEALSEGICDCCKRDTWGLVFDFSTRHQKEMVLCGSCHADECEDVLKHADNLAYENNGGQDGNRN